MSSKYFDEELERRIVNNPKSEMLLGLFADLTASSNEKVAENEKDNTFTTEVLYKLGYN